MLLNELLSEIKPELRRYRLQIIGAACLAFAWLIWLFPRWAFPASTGHAERLIAAGLLLACIPIDIYVSIKDLDTITQWIRRQFHERVDLVITIAMFVATCLVVGLAWKQPIHSHDVWLGCAIFAVNGHLFLTQ